MKFKKKFKVMIGNLNITKWHIMKNMQNEMVDH